MTKKEFLKRADDMREGWETECFSETLYETCSQIPIFFGAWKPCLSSFKKFIPSRSLWTWEDELFDSYWVPKGQEDLINSCRIILFELWVLYCLDEKLYKEF